RERSGRSPRREPLEEGGAGPLPRRRCREQRADQERREAACCGRQQQQGWMAARRQRLERTCRDQEAEDEAAGAEDTDAAVPHDGEPSLGVAAREAVENVGETVEVDTAGKNLPQ